MTDRFMEWASRQWLALGIFLKSRPMMSLAVFVGVIVFAAIISYTMGEINAQGEQIEAANDAFCNGPTGHNPERCRELFDALIKNPTPEQAERLKEIVQR